MRVYVHDYAGNPLHMQLSAALAERGNEVRHTYCSAYEGPTGNVPEASRLTVKALRGRNSGKESFLTRFLVDRAFGRALGRDVTRFQPDALLISNAPLDTAELVVEAAKRDGVAVVYWATDVRSALITEVLSERFGAVGRAIGCRYGWLEKRVLNRAHLVMALTREFAEEFGRRGVRASDLVIREPWAPVDVVKPMPKRNPFAEEHGLSNRFVVLYSGTLGWKHLPRGILQLAKDLHDKSNILILVVSDGPVVRELEAAARRANLQNLTTLPFQPYDTVPLVLASADVHLVTLDEFAARSSAPSKLWPCLSSGRPIVGFVPEHNTGARVIREAGCGWVFSEEEVSVAAARIRGLEQNRRSAEQLGRNARAYAERTSKIAIIAEEVEGYVAEAVLRATG